MFMKCLQQIPKTVFLILIVSITMVLVSCAGKHKNVQSDTANLTAQQKDTERKHLLKTAEDTLTQLYKSNPKAQKVIEDAYGYAVFTSTGYNLILYVGGKGRGVAFKNSDKKPVYMIMLRAGTGPGIGYDDYRQVLVFTSKLLYEQFIDVGLDASASANATMKIGDVNLDESGAITMVPGVSLYQINDGGIDIQANWGGMEFLKDIGLNQK